MKNNALWAVAIIAVVAILAILGATGQFSTTGSSDVVSAENCPDSTTSLSFSAKNAYKTSTSVSGLTPYGRIDGSDIVNLSAESSFPVGAQITDIYYSADDYIDVEVADFTVGCGMTKAPSVEMKPTDDPSTFKLLTATGADATDSATGGANNLTATASTLKVPLEIGQSTDKTTGKLIIIVEYDNTTQADSISLSGKGVSDYDPVAGKLDDVYSNEASSSVVEAFVIDEVEDGQLETYNILVYPESGQTLASSAIRVQYYSQQAFEDINSEVVVDGFDSDGTAKYEDEGDYDSYVGASS